MFGQHVHATWRARVRATPITPVLTLTTDGLVLGAGTVIVAATAPRRLNNLHGQEAGVLAILAAAYGKSIAPSVLGNIERAAKAWREGDDCLAHIHLAHTGLRPVDDVRAAYRLFLAEGAMREGASARDVLEALHLDVRDADVFEKYSPEQPRVPKGSGRISGQWTRVLSWLGGLSSAELAALGSYALRVLTPAGGAAAAFGLLFIPSPNDVHVEGEVSGVPGLRYSGNSDEALFHFSYDTGEVNNALSRRMLTATSSATSRVALSVACFPMGAS